MILVSLIPVIQPKIRGYVERKENIKWSSYKVCMLSCPGLCKGHVCHSPHEFSRSIHDTILTEYAHGMHATALMGVQHECYRPHDIYFATTLMSELMICSPLSAMCSRYAGHRPHEYSQGMQATVRTSALWVCKPLSSRMRPRCAGHCPHE